MVKLFMIEVKFINNGCYLSSEHLSTLPQSNVQSFSQFYSKKATSKRVLLLERDNFFTGGGPKIFARWKDWLWRLVPGLCISLLQSIQTTCNITRCC